MGDLQRRGHNGPPDLVDEGFDRGQLQIALGDNDAISPELEQSHPEVQQVGSSTDCWRLFAVRLVEGLRRDRATKFVDAVLAAAGLIITVQAAGLLPVFIGAVEATSKWIGASLL